MMRKLLHLVCLLIPINIAANEPVSQDKGQDSVLTELGDQYQNQIQLLQNRFRIDNEAETITMVFFREYGSPSVVLVMPDGSKIYSSSAPNGVDWYDAPSYDMITISNPTPGPWQAVGNILPESKIMVFSTLQLVVDPLPETVFAGEIIKHSAYLTNDGEPIEHRQFADVVALETKLISTNQPEAENFGASEQVLSEFEDNGQGMDEFPRDGTYTGEFNLSIPSGEWIPIYTVSTPMFSRQYTQAPLNVLPLPITLSHELDGGGNGFHKLTIQSDPAFIDRKSLMLNGRARFPNGEIHNFSLGNGEDTPREYLVLDYDAGIYRIKFTAFGETTDGRNFVVDIPQYSFEVAPKEELLTEDSEISSDSNEQDNAEIKQDNQVADTGEETVLDDPSFLEGEADLIENLNQSIQDDLLIWIVGLNGGLLVIGGFVIWFFLRDKSKKPSTTKVVKNKKNGYVPVNCCYTVYMNS
jgi:uncharacterized protein (TIGR03503 family)